MDPDNEMINVSDDEDLLTAYDVAENGGLDGNLKFVVEFKKPYAGNAPAEKLTDKKSIKAEKKREKKMKKQLKKSDKIEVLLGDLAIDQKDINQEEINELESSSSSDDECHLKKKLHKKLEKHV